jgi:hypothetical protein
MVRHAYPTAWDKGVPAEIRILDLAANAWKTGKTGPQLGGGLNMGSMAFDPNHNVAICCAGSGGMLLYRYKGGCPADAFGTQRR